MSAVNKTLLNSLPEIFFLLKAHYIKAIAN